MDRREAEDRAYMILAITLAVRGKGFVNPNPLVGAVLVRDGKIIGQGWHEKFGGLHAERNVFRDCKEDTAGATLYVTLEPCCHYGKTPPCTEAIIEHQIARVVVGMKDPNPLVAGKGMEILTAAGIEVLCGIEEEKCRKLNRIFLNYISTKRPWVVMKTAMTLDGKIAAYTGDSHWVTGEEARGKVQQMRAEYMGIIVGAGTLRADNPMLNCRLGGNVRQPVRIIADSKAGIALDSNIVQTAFTFRTIVAHTAQAEAGKIELLKRAGVETWLCETCDGRVSVADLLCRLGAQGIDAVLLEGGGELNYSFLQGNFVDEVYTFIAPKLIGGREARTPVEGDGIGRMNEATGLCEVWMEKVGEDFLIHGLISHVK